VAGTHSWGQIKRYEFVLRGQQLHTVYSELFNCVMDIRNEELISLVGSSKAISPELRLNICETSSKLLTKKNKKEFARFKK
jgi:hypothetical protein